MPVDAAKLLLLWGKTDSTDQAKYHPLLGHMLDVAAVAEALCPRFGRLPELGAAWIAYLAALHDVGKADPRFQMQAPHLAQPLRLEGLAFPPAPCPGRFPHESLSGEWTANYLVAAHGWKRGATQIVLAALGGHHGVFGRDFIPLDDTDDVDWSEWRTGLAEAVAHAIELPDLRLEAFTHASAAGLMLTGIVVLADWIASNRELYRYDAWDHDLMQCCRAYLDRARVEARRSVGSLDLLSCSTSSNPTHSFTDAWPACRDLRPSQAALDEVVRHGVRSGLAIIEAPMGEGKTESSIYLAEVWNEQRGLSGVYIALPTMATSNQMHVRYQQFLADRHPDSAPPRLIHGMSWLIEEDTPEGGAATDGDPDERTRSNEWFGNAKRALIAPQGVGTIDQALRAVLNVKHGFLRLLGLSPRTLIIDEVHAYDEYMTVLLERLLEWCSVLEVPVILLSATLSSHQKRKLVKAYAGSDAADGLRADDAPYPLLTFVSGDELTEAPVAGSPERRIHLQPHPGLLGDPAGTAQLAVDLVAGGGCACVIANTVADAQVIYAEAMRRIEPDTQVLLFHARFRAEARIAMADRITARFGPPTPQGAPAADRPHRAIVIATQVIEQSLDVDFDVLVSQIAPVDLLLQRCGRMHRHKRGERPTGLEPVLHLLLPPDGTTLFGASASVYGSRGRAHAPLVRTLALMQGRPEIVLPRDFRPLVEACYGRGPVLEGHVSSDDLLRAEAAWQEDTAKAGSQARVHLIPAPQVREFSLGRTTGAVSEMETGERETYFRAQTRRPDEGYETVRVLVLHEPEQARIATEPRAPQRQILRRLLLQQADVPGHWLRDVEPTDCLMTAPTWTGAVYVAAMAERRCCIRRSGRPDAWLVDDEAVGLRLDCPAS